MYRCKCTANCVDNRWMIRNHTVDVRVLQAYFRARPARAHPAHTRAQSLPSNTVESPPKYSLPFLYLPSDSLSPWRLPMRAPNWRLRSPTPLVFAVSSITSPLATASSATFLAVAWPSSVAKRASRAARARSACAEQTRQ